MHLYVRVPSLLYLIYGTNQHSHRGVHYFIAGAGSMTDKTGQTSSSAYKVHWEDGQYSSFATATASTSDFTIIYFNIAGVLRDTFHVLRSSFF